MIELLNPKKKLLASFENFDDVFEFIQKMVFYRHTNENFLDETTSFYNSKWSFVHYDHKTFSKISSEIHKGPLTKIEKVALEQKTDFIEICYGNPNEVWQCSVTPEIDVLANKKYWCHAYCKAFNYTLIDTAVNKSWFFNKLRGAS